MRKHHLKSAFTLIELLVVIAIIAILAAILFPVFAQAREKARAISCVSNEKQVALGILMYLQDYDEHYPKYWYSGETRVAPDPPFLSDPTIKSGTFGWNEAIYPYVKNTGVFLCPSSPHTAASGQWNDTNQDDTYPTGAVNYSINARLSGDTGGLDVTGQYPTLNEAAVEFPAVTILVTEASSNCSDGCASSDENEWGWEGRHVDKLNGDGWVGGNEPAAKTPDNWIQSGLKPPLWRHTDGANYAFCDGHVKWYNASSLGGLPGYIATEDSVARSGVGTPASRNGGKITYCPDSSCVYNVPPNP
jgi:prepilin-type N-terminal cleavage/methylation domain-containing protein/prepilin-type processing-associated H-X9-DG protein